jgi:hypothetical protein
VLPEPAPAPGWLAGEDDGDAGVPPERLAVAVGVAVPAFPGAEADVAFPRVADPVAVDGAAVDAPEAG